MINKKIIKKLQNPEIKKEFSELSKITGQTFSKPITNELAYRLKLRTRQDFINALIKYTSGGINIFSINDLTIISKMHRNQIKRCFDDWNASKIFIRVDGREAEKIIEDLRKQGKTNKEYTDNEVFYRIDLNNPIIKPAADLFYK